MKPSPAAVARFVVEDWCAAFHPTASADARMALASRVETALRAAEAEEREACAMLCDERAALWQRTETQSSSSPPLRAEARPRSVEAEYLGDAIRARSDG